MSHKNRPVFHDNNQPSARQTVSALYQGPIPHPEALAGYESVLPGAADRILKMAENESSHRHSLEIDKQRNFVSSERIGMICALSICLVALGGGFYCVLKGQAVAGTIISALPIGVIVTMFIQGKRKSWP